MLKVFVVVAVFLGGRWASAADPTVASLQAQIEHLQQSLNSYQKIVDDVAAILTDYRRTMTDMGKHMMQMELFVQERIRSDGHSGAKQMRVDREGTRSFFSNSHVGTHILGMHNHVDYDRTMGLGEMNIVMNGVDFKTRHNDYKLSMPSKTSTGYDETQYIDYPPVPPAVLAKATVEEQVAEMKEYFRAFKNQDYTHRDYRPYFKAVMCYIEGAWTLGKDFKESFPSDRHYFDTTSWEDLEEKIRYTAQSGTKSIKENFGYLPSIIYNVVNGVPLTAQWNYRILCAPIDFDFPTSYLKQEEDLMLRMSRNMTQEEVLYSRMARFRVVDRTEDEVTQFTVLDKIMQSIPGKNNYPAKMYDNSSGAEMENVEKPNYQTLNTGYYSRYYRTEQMGAMGTKVIHRGFSDENLWVAETTHPQIMPVSMTDCWRDPVTRAVLENTCTRFTHRFTYALPLEIVYMTPLLAWNPYDLQYTAVDNKVYTPNLRDNRDGSLTKEKAYNGTNISTFYRTPSQFFVGNGIGDFDPGDTGKTAIGVLDRHGNVRSMEPEFMARSPTLGKSASGTL
ncbi:hypothetical protein C0Q70_11591 [Pomacea canaliculata]|uniref:Uncharacterized protein n=1 Tax=Pomacea canaliculata TaxID=400727 RepID=A0A2T7P6D6_POMCA|nr:hypothetical protein C0Q70_11591 [Pomacea canaliculata]